MITIHPSCDRYTENGLYSKSAEYEIVLSEFTYALEKYNIPIQKKDGRKCHQLWRQFAIQIRRRKSGNPRAPYVAIWIGL